MTGKNADYFKRLLGSQNKQSKAFVSKVTVTEKAQETSYLVTELITSTVTLRVVRGDEVGLKKTAP
jgi:hypothetical protein